MTRRSTQAMPRRQFLKSSLAAGAGMMILPGGFVSGANAPSNKLNIALIGVWGRGARHWHAIKGENVVALCDVNQQHLDKAAAEFPKAKHYVDWRQCLDHPGLDAVLICTLDHTHAFITNWAMLRGLHVYCEKPLANTVAEARLVRETYLKNKHKIATQVGTQRHAYPNFNRVREWIRDGAIGELKDVKAWGNRQLRKPGYLPDAGKPPKHLNWDLWLGPSPYHPYNPGYVNGKPGLNCLNWNMYWDFGSGQVGDMGSHTMDIAWWAIDGDRPTSATAKGDAFNPEVTPVELTTTFKLPANDWRGPISVSWLQGGAMPHSPRNFVDLNKIGHGALFKGTRGFIVADFNNRLLLPLGKDTDMSYYNRRAKEQMLEPLGDFQGEWINAAKGDLQTTCNFDYGGTMIEMMLLGLVAYRAETEIAYDGATGKTDSAKADQYLTGNYRDGWNLVG